MPHIYVATPRRTRRRPASSTVDAADGLQSNRRGSFFAV
jgi:hypothetical protein